jgi:GT2 family glycosyltransferase
MNEIGTKMLSVVIVNYNTREELRHCLSSIFDSKQNMAFEVWVVDNNSSDFSAEMVEAEFPFVRLIRNRNNTGFAVANNMAIKQIDSKFMLLLNPDTIVFDEVFDKTTEFMRDRPRVGMVTCKLVKADGTLDLACRRSFPSAFDGFCRATGLSGLFPTSRLFARYNVTYLDEDETNEVNAINGAFMMVRREAIEEVGLLDEDYFMYMEDLDWCYRFKKKGWKIYYLPNSTVVHLKGQAGKKNSSKMIVEFFKSMEMFCKKQYATRQSATGFYLTLIGVRLWRMSTLVRNMLRPGKRVTP